MVEKETILWHFYECCGNTSNILIIIPCNYQIKHAYAYNVAVNLSQVSFLLLLFFLFLFSVSSSHPLSSLADLLDSEYLFNSHSKRFSYQTNQRRISTTSSKQNQRINHLLLHTSLSIIIIIVLLLFNVNFNLFFLSCLSSIQLSSNDHLLSSFTQR